MFKNKAKAITIASKHSWQASPYFTFIQECTRDELLDSQIPFYYAVQAFPLLLLKLASQIVDEDARYLIVENIWQEHGQGEKSKYHTNTFKQHLNALGHNGEMHQNPFITVWLEQLFSLQTLKEQFHHLAAIEYMYAVISETIATKLLTLPLLTHQEHYTKHSVLDWSHGEELLTSMDKCHIPFDEELFKQAQLTFIQLFAQMATITTHSLQTIQQSQAVCFYYSRESSNVIDEVIESIGEKDLRVLCVCSGGENPIHYLSNPWVSKVTAFDMNSSQLAVCRNKIMGKMSTAENGRFEYLFNFVRQYFFTQNTHTIVDDFAKHPELLDYAIDQVFDDRVLTALFTEEATKYSSRKFSEHFKTVYRHMIEEAALAKSLHSNTKNVLFGEAIRSPSLDASRCKDLTLTHNCAHKVIGDDKFDIIDLSNIGDWMPYEDFSALLKHSYQQLNVGGRIILRKLLGDYSLTDLPLGEVTPLLDQTGFYLETVMVKK